MQRRSPRQTVLRIVLLIVYAAALGLDLADRRAFGGGLLLLATCVMLVLVAIESRRTRLQRDAVRQRDRDFYAAKAEGASGPEAWVLSARPRVDGESIEDQDDAGQPL